MPTETLQFYNRSFFLYILKTVSKKLRETNHYRRNVNHSHSVFSATELWHFSRSLDSITTSAFSPSDKVFLFDLISITFKYQYGSGQHAKFYSFMQGQISSPSNCTHCFTQCCTVTKETTRIEVTSHQHSCTALTCISVFQVLENDVQEGVGVRMNGHRLLLQNRQK